MKFKTGINRPLLMVSCACLARVVVSLALSSTALIATSDAGVGANEAGSQDKNAPRDGQHDFDFDFGTWSVGNTSFVIPISTL